MMYTDSSRVMDLCQEWSFAYSLSAPQSEFTSAEQARQGGLCFHPAQVPGNLELDLVALGVLEEPFYAMNITRLRELEAAHVWYSRSFLAQPLPAGWRAELVFEGIDCIASIYLNGKLLANADNMLVEHVLDVSSLLQEENELFVHIRPPREAARLYPYPLGVHAHNTSYEALYVRKAPHMYGWDIMPRALSAGLWRPVSLRLSPPERIESLYLETRRLSQDLKSAELSLKYLAATQATPGDTYQMRLEGVCGESRFCETFALFFDAGEWRLTVPEPKLWWPNGYGEPNLYQVRATLLKNGAEIDSKQFSLGIRTVSLERTTFTDEDAQGEFCFFVNGVRVFAKGSNWVPLDAFHSRDLKRTEAAIELAVQCNSNMLRCWGGNVYESNRFFDLCDAQGLMVWQDFAMACAVYPQDEEFSGRLAEEARKVVQRLRQHPSLVLWAGDNECDLAWAYWYGQGDPKENVLTRKVLPGVLRQEDPGRPYLPSSPYLGEEAYKPGEKYLAENHLWGPRGYYKAEFYREALCHFVSEIGYHGCPSPESVRQFIDPQHLWPCQDNPQWNLHSTSPVPGTPLFGPENYRVELMANQVRELFGSVPDNLDEFAFASQATQAEAKKTFIEMFRGGKWRRTGILWWNLLDGWPQFSDAVVDYYLRKKLAYGFITRSQQHLCVMCQEPVGSSQGLVVSNDTLKNHVFVYRVTDLESGQVLAEGERLALANAVSFLEELPYDAAAQRFYLIEWRSPLGPGRNHYLAGQPPFELGKYREWLRRAGMIEPEPCEESVGGSC